MKKNLFILLAIVYLNVLVAPTRLTAQQHPRYKLIDLGTLGGPHSYGSVNGEGFRLLNNSGEVASYADLSAPDPNAAFGCYAPDCYQANAFLWKNGVMSDIGALPLDNNSAAGSINDRGWATGQSQSSTLDPILKFPQFHAVLWAQGKILDLGTLPGGSESLGIYINNAGQVIGFSTVSTAIDSDPIGFFGFPTHTFIWQNGTMLDIGTLGGNDTGPGASCSNPPPGVVVGGSSTTTIPNPDTGLPTVDPFLWRNEKMVDLGTLGGTNGFAQCVNNRLQIIGQSSVAANPAACNFPAVEPENAGPGCHAFFWEKGLMTDLGTLGGDNSEALWLNDAGVVVGSADLPGPSGNQPHDAVVWINGKIHDLGTVLGDACSRSRAINASGQVVGGSSDCHNFLHAFVWDGNAGMVDLNTVIAPGSGYQLTNAFNINDRGEILAKAAPLGFTPNDDADLGHLVLLVPCDPESEDCSPILQNASVSLPSSSTLSSAALNEQRLGGRHRIPGPQATLSPTTLTLSSEHVGTTSPAQPVTLSNSGNGTLSIASITISANFAETNNCGSTLASGASCTISVTFTPKTTGTLDGTLSVTDNTTNSPQTVSLIGNGPSSGGRCTPEGVECPPQFPPCCPGLTCVPASTRAFCLAI